MMIEGNLVLSLNNVSVSYRRRAGFMRWDKFWALNDVSFDLFQGETLGVIGRNGAGKSSLLKVLAGIISVDKGKVFNNECSISMLGLQVGFIPHLTGRENAIMSGMLMGLSKREMEMKLKDIIEFSELGDFFDEPVRSYSIGMKARLGFSTAIQVDPDILLIDEVLGVGDAHFRSKSAEVIKSKIKSNKTIVFVSHNINMIRNLCNRVVWIERGNVVQVGETSKILPVYEASCTR